MLDLKFIRENAELVRKSIKDRSMQLDIDELLTLDVQRRSIIKDLEGFKYNKNTLSQEIGQKIAKKEDVSSLKGEIKAISQKIDDLEPKVEDIDKKLENILLLVPNIPNSSVPVGPEKEANKIVKEFGKVRKFLFEPRPHTEICELLDIIDFKRASKITGSSFILYKGAGARLERALINFMLDLHTKKHGYTEIFPPFLVNRKSMTGTGQLPKLEEDMYRLKDEDLFLIPTAEVPLTNIYRDEVILEKDLPIYYTAYTACFRREAGSYGKDTKGLIRVHQFDKVELVKFVKPGDSYDELESLLKNAEKVLQLLELPYRVTLLSTAGISFAASKCYDIELWAPGSKMHLEVSSCSNFEDFQARRANIKYKEKNTQKLAYVHTLNGSGVATARLLIAILENYQTKTGTVLIPKALWPYMDRMKEIKIG
ncbi:MAG: serine--tRNA ligase [Candidatus Omnitrophica bacterium]|nr:serine--tRNA ligase [Candidatus Omnitrophota bacterium]MBU4487784.1 serine--tRNA ligase [Candidatus Omnitrophota bacterium]MCG2705576.1 serine--tRNA ligase [Candidatus Omnitrophota bacterium]